MAEILCRSKLMNRYFVSWDLYYLGFEKGFRSYILEFVESFSLGWSIDILVDFVGLSLLHFIAYSMWELLTP